MLRPQDAAHELAKEARVVHVCTKLGVDTKIRSISVEELLDTHVGSVTICVRLNEDTTDRNLQYKGVTLLFTEKSTLKSPVK